MKKVVSTISILIFLVFIAGTSCGSGADDLASESMLPERPNILWLVTEDMGQYIPPFGDSTIQTPNLSKLASEGVVYTNFYSTSGVCAPSRAGIATGMYPSAIGANHMRTGSHTSQTGLRAYEALPPAEVKMLSEMLRMQGYFCTNNFKEDYQFKAPVTAWDEKGPYAHWRNRAADQPFYSVFNFTDTHESGLFEPYGHRYIETRHYHAGDTSYHWPDGRMTEEETSHHIPTDLDFPIPPYLPDNEVVRRDMWKMYNNIAEMDRQVGAVLKQLEKDGLLEKTIIFFYGDHGGPLPRQKRLIYDSGLKTPLIIRFPEKAGAGSKQENLLSFIDLAPTLLSLAGVEPPQYLHGQAFLGEYKAKEKRKYIHAAADRFDEITDVIRAVRDERYKYIRNYRPEQGYYLPVGYREQIPTMKELLRLRDAGKLNSMQAQWFRDHKPVDELFDLYADPHELNNLAEDPSHKDKLDELSTEMDRWLAEIGDEPDLAEKDLIVKLWSGQDTQPFTAAPMISLENGLITMACQTEGASIGYKVIPADGSTPSSWSLYQGPFELSEGASLRAIAHRIGYKASEIVD